MHMKHETRGKGIFVMWVDIRRRWSAGSKAGGAAGRGGGAATRQAVLDDFIVAGDGGYTGDLPRDTRSSADRHEVKHFWQRLILETCSFSRK